MDMKKLLLEGSLSPSTLPCSGNLSSLGIKGDSAYEIAVKHGFQGTEQEWIDSFKNYNELLNKPTINGETLIGDLSCSDLGLQPEGDYVENNEDYKNDVNNWNIAYKHSQTEHAQSNAQENVIEKIKVNGKEVAVKDKEVDIIVSDIKTDNTLTVPDMAADAKEVGDRLNYHDSIIYPTYKINNVIDVQTLYDELVRIKNENEYVKDDTFNIIKGEGCKQIATVISSGVFLASFEHVARVKLLSDTSFECVYINPVKANDMYCIIENGTITKSFTINASDDSLQLVKDNYVRKIQGAENANKVLITDENGKIICGDLVSEQEIVSMLEEVFK